ncbi:uncharacterized protein PgNI_03733 [Pyricularia grisea]|uniref:Uncharacterized protein n=1 Tax=Pyricularia grisea TaxID=148305 RepID=A0A6P8BEL5_PYRGI|nr:uncharacterized protein PgNI_03733 [Pyricularia grisea]TLD14230.1 hypothetical protein PgNI_03733 [Pyricularia grisea]
MEGKEEGREKELENSVREIHENYQLLRILLEQIQVLGNTSVNDSNEAPLVKLVQKCIDTNGEPQKTIIGNQVPKHSARSLRACLAMLKRRTPACDPVPTSELRWPATRVHAVMHPVPGQRLGLLPSMKDICGMQSILRSSHGFRNRLPCSRMCSSG